MSEPRSIPLHRKILIGMFVGALAGLGANWYWGPTEQVQSFVRNVTYPAGQIFLRLIFMVVIPLIFSALVLGVAELGDVRRLGRIGARTLAFTITLSAISVVVGIAMVNLVRPGDGFAEADKTTMLQMLGKSAADVQQPPQRAGMQILLDLIPENPLKAMVDAFKGEMLAVMVFSLFIGIALTLCERETVEPIMALLRGVYEVVMKVIAMAMRLAPYGVAALLFSLTARFGLEILSKLGWYVATVIVGLAIHQFIVYSLVLKYIVGYSPAKFFSRIREVLLTAFSTSSSNATLPVSMRVAESELGIPRQIGAFVLTVGSTANQNGTALYEGITVLFLAQFFGVHLNLWSQVTVVLMSILAGIGTAGVPGGSLPMVGALLVSIGVPWEGIGIILGVDRLLDMCRTVLNVSGDVVAAAYVARCEGHELKA
ncbi:MAG TPA: dicarboxylate/amino acid:cation symporter [Patescibacteria group bacterium]|jgi:DAACS family dicarboxylate/amino acid:cation (Na+ or H+) symporter|nr:dicarboxylate/amino acid:cation symporter [Patescibacteria group bacterium]